MQYQIPLFYLAICLLFLVVFGEASTTKIRERVVPDWFLDQFKNTWMGKFPLRPQYWLIALVELGVALLFVIALATGEPFSTGPKFWMGYGLLGAAGLFTMLCFGQRVSSDFGGAASSYLYAFGALALWFIVSLGAA